MKKAKKLSQETVNKVIAFYDSDENSMMCPGQKEFRSLKDEIGNKTSKQTNKKDFCFFPSFVSYLLHGV